MTDRSLYGVTIDGTIATVKRGSKVVAMFFITTGSDTWSATSKKASVETPYELRSEVVAIKKAVVAMYRKVPFQVALMNGVPVILPEGVDAKSD